ncbi:hypothetical protein INR49_026589, partial [Caranx melampygus]
MSDISFVSRGRLEVSRHLQMKFSACQVLCVALLSPSFVPQDPLFGSAGARLSLLLSVSLVRPPCLSPTDQSAPGSHSGSPEAENTVGLIPLLHFSFECQRKRQGQGQAEIEEAPSRSPQRRRLKTSSAVDSDDINVHSNKVAAEREPGLHINNKETCALESRRACLC